MRSRTLSSVIVRRTIACAVISLGACSVFEIPLDGFTDASAGGSTSGASGASGDSGFSGDAGQSGTSGRDGSGGSGGVPFDGGVGEWWRIPMNDVNCASEGVPDYVKDRPTPDSEGDIPPIYLAQSRIRLGTTNDDKELTDNPDAWEDMGFDFDKRCTSSRTCEDPTTQMLVKQFACKTPDLVPFDGKNCRDNEIGKLFKEATGTPLIGTYFGMTEVDWNCELRRGGFGWIFRVSNYSGKENDSSVRLDVYTSLGLKVPSPPSSCREGGKIEGAVSTTWTGTPLWLPTAHFKIARSSIAFSAPMTAIEVQNSATFDSTAYVRNGYLVAQLPPNSEFWLNGQNTIVPGFRLILDRPLLVAEIKLGPDDTWRLDKATLAGVVNPSLMLRSFRELGFCENMCRTYDIVVDYLNVHLDALLNGPEHLPEVPCNALTIAIDFEATQAKADKNDVVDAAPPADPSPGNCPAPRHALAPKKGCVCDSMGRLQCPDGGT